MKLRNKKTGEILLTDGLILPEQSQTNYRSLAELNDEWEDYKEPKRFYGINEKADIWEMLLLPEDTKQEDFREQLKKIGNYFETKKDAEKAVEKLKAWKRLRDKGFKFGDWRWWNNCAEAYLEIKAYVSDGEISDDLDLLFGGEE